MELNKNRWYVKWFFLSLFIIDTFTNDSAEHHFKKYGTNLCQFMRVTLLWPTLVVAMNITVYGLLLGCLTYFPFRFLGLMGMLTMYGVPLAIVAAVFMLYFAVRAAKWISRVFKTQLPALSRALQERKARAAARRASRDPSFGSLVWQWMVASKRRFCPIITFSEQQP